MTKEEKLRWELLRFVEKVGRASSEGLMDAESGDYDKDGLTSE